MNARREDSENIQLVLSTVGGFWFPMRSASALSLSIQRIAHPIL